MWISYNQGRFCTVYKKFISYLSALCGFANEYASTIKYIYCISHLFIIVFKHETI